MAAMTFGDLIECYLRSLGDRPSVHRYRSIHRLYITPLGWCHRPAAAITRHQIMLLAQKLAHAPSQCIKGVNLISQAYTWASSRIDETTERPLYSGENPAFHALRAAKIPKLAPREILFHESEIRRLLTHLGMLSVKYQAFFVTRLLTPARITELREMRRDAVDLDTGKWFKRVTKNGKPQYTLIPKQALDYLHRLPAEGEYFFTGFYGRPLSQEAPRKAWSRFRREIGLHRIQVLDFRRTLATYLYTEIKADDLTAKAVLNHYDGRPVAVYTRLNYDRLAEIIQAYADWVWAFKPEEVLQCTLFI